jgi:hypothetical protein
MNAPSMNKAQVPVDSSIAWEDDHTHLGFSFCSSLLGYSVRATYKGDWVLRCRGSLVSRHTIAEEAFLAAQKHSNSLTF